MYKDHLPLFHLYFAVWPIKMVWPICCDYVVRLCLSRGNLESEVSVEIQPTR